MTFLQILSYVAVGVVAIILLAGLWNLARRGSPNTSQKLMRARVFFQLIALIVVMTLLYFIQRNGGPAATP